MDEAGVKHCLSDTPLCVLPYFKLHTYTSHPSPNLIINVVLHIFLHVVAHVVTHEVNHELSIRELAHIDTCSHAHAVTHLVIHIVTHGHTY